MTDDRLPSWRPGAVRDAVVAFLDAAADVPTEQRVACFDNDGTLWCEHPSYVRPSTPIPPSPRARCSPP